MVGPKNNNSSSSGSQQTGYRGMEQSRQALSNYRYISVPLDTNVGKKVTEKINHYMGLVTELQRVYRQYKFSVIPIVVGCLGCIPTSLEKNIKDIGIKNYIIGRLQKTAILGSLKIVKTFLKMRDM